MEDMDVGVLGYVGVLMICNEFIDSKCSMGSVDLVLGVEEMWGMYAGR